MLKPGKPASNFQHFKCVWRNATDHICKAMQLLNDHAISWDCNHMKGTIKQFR